jgi:hypothetical protein
MTSLADLYEIHTKECRERPLSGSTTQFTADSARDGPRMAGRGRAARIDANDIAEHRRSCAF